MIPRTLEPEVMDGPEQCRAYAEADFATPNAAFVERFLATFPELTRGHLLDLGGGPADIPIRLCQALPDVRVTGVDASAPMLALAVEAARDAGVASRLTLVEDQLPCSTLEGAFDGLISNSLLHHLPDPNVFWSDVVRYGQPGAAFLMVDLTRPPSTDEAQRLMQLHSNGEPEVLRHDFYHSLLAAFTPDEVNAQLAAHGLSGLNVAVISDRHLAVWGRLTG
ncbi:MAG: SAM-dependent methyltransferase [Myxococcales bacterium]|nr:SAM-dependent methyltransferase [Myxococcales bacterium]